MTNINSPLYKYKINGMIEGKRTSRIIKLNYHLHIDFLIEKAFKELEFEYVTSVDEYSNIYNEWFHHKV